ncbi:MAG: trypsin-like serine protease [Phycisphaerales bacterium]
MVNWTRSGGGGYRAMAAAAVVCCAGLAGRAEAIVIRHDRFEQAHIDLASQPQFQSVGTVSLDSSLYASAVLISPNFVLTAAHVAFDRSGQQATDHPERYTFSFGGQVRTGTAFNIHPQYLHGFASLGYDIAVVQLSSPINSVIPAVLYNGNAELNQQVTSVGYGLFGTGTTGITPTDLSTAGTRRAGTNIIDFPLADPGIPNFGNWSSDILLYDFDDPTDGIPNMMGSEIPTDMEDNIAYGDSGGGSFMMTPDGWRLVGIHSFFFRTQPTPLNPLDGYGYGSGLSRVGAYLNFISQFEPSLVPTPGAAGLMGLGMLAVARRRR